MTEQLFVKQADSYAKARPTYPASLFQRLASLTPQHQRVWDVGTGNGQAAVMLAEHYKSVVATDVSEPQLSLAAQHPNITYSKLSATPSAEELERVVGPEGSVDLVTVATALHWFDLDRFYPIVKHVLRKPGGVFAAWSYGEHQISPEIDELMEEWHQALKPYTAPEVEYVSQAYRNLPFPFQPAAGQAGKEVEVEFLQMEKPMTLEGFLVLWKSSSRVQNALEQGFDLFSEDTLHAVSNAWGSVEVRVATFSIFLLIGTDYDAPTN